MDVFQEYTIHIDSRDLDLFGCCRPSALLGHLQDAATLAAAELHVSRSEVVQHYHAFWMLVRIRCTLTRPLRWDEPVTIKTWHRGGKTALMYREFDLSVSGKPVGRALSAWVLADLDTRKLLYLSDVEECRNSSGGSLCRKDTLHKLRIPKESMVLSEVRRMRYSDTDVNGHVNNSKYADFACDALELESMPPDQFLSALEMNFLAECRPGEEIELHTSRAGSIWYASGSGKEGKERFDAALTLDKKPPED